jgi:hypothetical protein
LVSNSVRVNLICTALFLDSLDRATGTGRTPALAVHHAAHRPKRADSIEKAIADMNLPSEALVIDPKFRWQHRPQVTMHAPRGATIPRWWKGNRPTWTHAVVPWFTAFEAQGNRAVNSRVQVKNLRFFVLSNRSRQWHEIDLRERPEVTLWTYPFRRVEPDGQDFLRAEPDGGVSVVPAYPLFLHGWGHGRSIGAKDIGATFTAMDFRLTLHAPDGIDDRAVAKYVVGVGADYYPDMALRWSLDFAPGVGNGRMLLARPYWRTATLLVPNPDHGITFETLRRNPPPTRTRTAPGAEKPAPGCEAGQQ